MSAVFAVCAVVFWYGGYVSALSYHEELQMFLFDYGYLVERLSLPGGAADYVSEFLVQLYFYPFVGAVILALLLTAVQLLTWVSMRRMGVGARLYPFSFVPALLLWFHLGDANVLLSTVVALLVAQSATIVHQYLSNWTARVALSLVAVPVLYWLIGPMVIVTVLMDSITDFRRRGNTGTTWLITAARLIVAVACPLVAQYVVQYPLSRLMVGINYFRFPLTMPKMHFVVLAVVAFWPLLCAAKLPFRPFNGKGGIATVGVEVALVALLGVIVVPRGFDAKTYELLDYDYLVRRGLWDKLIDTANRKQPSAPMSVASLNLALAETGQLADNMFAYYQNGVEGLLPPFSRDFISPLPTAEAYLALGMVNTAQRFIFEAQEAIPNYRKSARMTKRLAETNMINGQYAVAAKYVRMLKKTLCYRSWAEKAEMMLRNRRALAADPWIAELRSKRYVKDFLFSDSETDQMLGLLYQHNYKNRMAFEYLMAWLLLNRDMAKFMKYYPIGQYAGYSRIPTSYQEALVFNWTQTHNSFRGMPWSIDQSTMMTMSDFGQRYTANPNDPQLATGYLGRTYWCYLLKGAQQKQ